MDGIKYDFLTGVLGVEGAKALAKAAKRSERLENAILPRAILAWLGVTARNDYEGSLPGVTNTYLRFSKSDTGFNGAIGFGDEMYHFKDVTVYHLAAGIAVVLGADSDKLNPELEDLDVSRLGKSIDVLAKARVAVAALKEESEEPPKKAKARIPGVKTKKAEMPSKGKADEPSFDQPMQPQAPTKQTAQPSMPRTGTGTRAVSVTKAESERRCSICGKGQFTGSKFTGCYCLADLAKSVKAVPSEDGYKLTFKAGTDAEVVLTVLDVLKGN